MFDAQFDVARPENPLPDFPRLDLHRGFRSSFLQADRDLIVYRPASSHADASRSLPVLYLHDGQNLFDGRTSYIPGRTWGIQETADALIAAGEVAPLLIVGIYHAGEKRVDEYTPTRDAGVGAGGQAALYGRMLLEEIMPFIGRQYRVLPGPESTGVGGSSLGGLLSLYLALENSGVFGKTAVLSPSLWWADRSIFSFLPKEPRQEAEKPRIWLDMGMSEGSSGLRDADLLHRTLVQTGWVDGADVSYLRVPGGTHEESAWAKRVGPMLKFLFPGKRCGFATGRAHVLSK